MPYLDENYKHINERIFETYKVEFELPSDVCRDIAFHMTGWLDDYEALRSVFDLSQELSTKQIQVITEITQRPLS